jgi:serine/threonine protein kinase
MFLRRKPAFVRESVVVPAKALPAVYLSRSPTADYNPIGITTSGWVGVHRRQTARQLVAVQQVPEMSITDFRRMVEIAHRNITRLLGVYYEEDHIYLVYEYVELDLFDILPLLSEVELASVVSQVGYCFLTC